MADLSWHTASYTTTVILEHMASVNLLYLKFWQPKAVRFQIIHWLLTLQTAVGMAAIDFEHFASCLEHVQLYETGASPLALMCRSQNCMC